MRVLLRILLTCVSLSLVACDGLLIRANGDGGAAGSDSGTDGGDGGLPDGGTDGGTDAGTGTACPSLPAPTGQIHRVRSGQPGDFAGAVSAANAGDTILVEDGTYAMGGSFILLTQPGVTLRSESGNRDAVVIDGEYNMAGAQIITVDASDVTLADITIRRAYTHAIHVNTAVTNNGPIQNVRIYNVRIVDPGEQGIKVNPNTVGGDYIDNSEIGCSAIELTATGRTAVRNNCYTGGIDVHGGRNWWVHDNVIEGFWCSTGLSEHGIHFWRGSRDVVVERNQLRNNARGIGFGLGNGSPGRTYGDINCGGNTIGNYGGTIRNNSVFANDSALFASAARVDTGIGLENSCNNTLIAHNSLFFTQAPSSSAIEWRFSATNAVVTNNLSSHALISRDSATASLAGNLTTVTAGAFVNAPVGDLHLKPTGTIAHNAGVPLASVTQDFDRETRHPTSPDVGMDEVP